MTELEFIQEQKFLHEDLASNYDTMESLFSKKLWHQLTEELSSFLANPNNRRGDNFYQLYEGFIAKFEPKLSQLRAALLVAQVGYSFEDPQRAIDFFKNVLKNRSRLGEEASLCIESDIAVMLVRLGLADEARVQLDKVEKDLAAVGKNVGEEEFGQVDQSSGEAAVFSRVYRAMAEYRKFVGPPSEFYKMALLYLAYTPADELSTTDKYTLATDMALAALTGDGVYNFGEVIATPVLAALQGSPNQYLYDLVLALNKGNIDEFNAVVDNNRDAYFSQEVLKNCHEKVQQKVVVLALMNMVFELPSHERCISYSAIAEVSRVPLDQVDWILMRAMSLGLIKGKIDEVAQTVNVSWVQPRVLDKSEIVTISSQLSDWVERVKGTLVSVEEQTLELYV